MFRSRISDKNHGPAEFQTGRKTIQIPHAVHELLDRPGAGRERRVGRTHAEFFFKLFLTHGIFNGAEQSFAYGAFCASVFQVNRHGDGRQ